MKLTATATITAPRAKVFAAIIDPTILQQSIEGCEKMVKTGDDSYDVQLRIGIAAFKGNYGGQVKLQDQRPPESFALLLEGRGGPGFVKGSAQLQLVEQGNQTQVNCVADVQVGGLIAALGSRLIEPAARKMIQEFFRRFNKLVGSP